MHDILSYLLDDPGQLPPSCERRFPGCTTNHGRDEHLAGWLCDAPITAVETRGADRPVEVSAGRWTDGHGAVPLVCVEQGAGVGELSPAAARRLAVALLAAADRAEVTA